jgi:drug/metabolite transporter, DME family
MAGSPVAALRSASRSLDRRVAATPAGRDRTVDLTGSIAVVAAAFQACYFTAVGQTSVSLATLVAIGVAPVVVITVETVQCRPTGLGDHPRTGHPRAGLGRPGTAGRGTPRRSRPARGPGRHRVRRARRHGFAVMTLLDARPVTGHQ